MGENVEPYYENGLIQEMNIIMGENQRLREIKLIMGENVRFNRAFIQDFQELSEELAAVQAQQEADIIRGEHVELRENLAVAQAQIKGLQKKNEQNKRKVIMDQMDHKKRVSAGVLMIISYICLFAGVFNVVIDNCKLREDMAGVQANVTRMQEKTGQSERENDVNEIISTTDLSDLERKNIFHNFVASISSQYYKMRTQEDGKHRTSGSGVLRNFFLTLNLDLADDKVVGNQINTENQQPSIPIHLSSPKSAVTGNTLTTGINISNILAVYLSFIPRRHSSARGGTQLSPVHRTFRSNRCRYGS